MKRDGRGDEEVLIAFRPTVTLHDIHTLSKVINMMSMTRATVHYMEEEIKRDE